MRLERYDSNHANAAMVTTIRFWSTSKCVGDRRYKMPRTSQAVHLTSVDTANKVAMDFEKGCLNGTMCTISWLNRQKQAITNCMTCYPGANHVLEYRGNTSEIRNWTIWVQVQWVQWLYRICKWHARHYWTLAARQLCLVQRCMYQTTQVVELNVTVAESAPQVNTRSVCIICTTIGQYFNSDKERCAGLSAIAEPLVNIKQRNCCN